MQLIVNIFITSSIYLLIAIAFLLVYNTEKFFNISFAGLIVSSLYLTYLFNKLLEFSVFISSIVAIFLTILISSLLFVFIFKPLKKRNANPFVLLIASLGVYTIIIGILGFFFGYESIFISYSASGNTISYLNSSISDVQCFTIILSMALFIFIIYLFNCTSLGFQFKAVSSNSILSSNFGINNFRVSFIVNIIATFLFALVGILVGLDTGATPNIGFDLLLYGIIVMILSGIGSFNNLVLASLFLASAQHLAAYFIDTKWMQAIAYATLIIFLIWRPLGLSGKQLKKIEI